MEDFTPFGYWLHRHGISYAAAAEELDITRAYAQMLAVGKATPRLSGLAIEIERWSRRIDPSDPVVVSSWLPWCRKFDELKKLLG